MFLIQIKTERERKKNKGEQLLLLRQTKDLSLISVTLLQFKEEKKKKNKNQKEESPARCCGEVTPEGSWPQWRCHSCSSCPWPSGCSPRLPILNSSCRRTRRRVSLRHNFTFTSSFFPPEPLTHLFFTIQYLWRKLSASP